jgi:hypothetical protein
MTYKIPAIIKDATNEQKWNNIRAWRDAELAKSDWTQLSDSVADKAAWATYRQALRDLPAQAGLAEEAVFPAQPGGN